MKWYIKALIGFGILGIVMMISMYSYVKGTYNEMVSKENAVVYQYKENQNVYSNMWKKFKEATQVTTMYAEDLEKVYKGAIQGRYGEGGSKAVFQMLKEQNPNLDVSIYKQIQVMIESGRASFEENQKTLLDKKRVYEVYLQTFPNNILAGFFGFPKVDLSKFDIVTDNRTENAFATKKDDEIKLR